MKKMTFVFMALILASFLFFIAPESQAYSIGFYRITDNGNPDVGSQLSVDVTAAAIGQVSFKFFNNVETASSITDIYFDDGTLLGIASISDSGAGVDFGSPAAPGDLPGGNLATPAFVTTAGFSADSAAPVSQNGVNSSTEWVTIVFDLINGKSFADTLAAIDNKSLRIGLHVQAIGSTGGSDSYVNNPNEGVTPVPIPAAAWLLGSGLLGLVAIRRRVK